MSIKLNIYFFLLVHPTKSVFKYLKKHTVYNIHRLAWSPMLMGSRAIAQRAHVLIWHWYHGENKLHFNEIMFTLYKTLFWICMVPAHWNNSPWKNMLLHSDTLSWFRANLFFCVFFLLLFLSAACREATTSSFIVFGLTRLRLDPVI